MPDNIRPPSTMHPAAMHTALPYSHQRHATDAKMIIGICGFIGSGKDTFAKRLLIDHQFEHHSFARTLKDAVAGLFGWDRTMLEGATPESRAWRDQIDPWWAERLGIPHLTPRWALQNFATDVMRTYFHDEIFVAGAENGMRTSSSDIVLPDVRFPNEFRAIQRQRGIVVRVKRGEDPKWFNTALLANTASEPRIKEEAYSEMKRLKIHESEWRWIGQPIYATIENDGSLEDLLCKVEPLIKCWTGEGWAPAANQE